MCGLGWHTHARMCMHSSTLARPRRGRRRLPSRRCHRVLAPGPRAQHRLGPTMLRCTVLHSARACMTHLHGRDGLGDLLQQPLLIRLIGQAGEVLVGLLSQLRDAFYPHALQDIHYVVYCNVCLDQKATGMSQRRVARGAEVGLAPSLLRAGSRWGRLPGLTVTLHCPGVSVLCRCATGREAKAL